MAAAEFTFTFLIKPIPDTTGLRIRTIGAPHHVIVTSHDGEAAKDHFMNLAVRLVAEQYLCPHIPNGGMTIKKMPDWEHCLEQGSGTLTVKNISAEEVDKMIKAGAERKYDADDGLHIECFYHETMGAIYTGSDQGEHVDEWLLSSIKDVLAEQKTGLQ